MRRSSQRRRPERLNWLHLRTQAQWGRTPASLQGESLPCLSFVQITSALFLCNYIPTYPLSAVVAALPCLSRSSVYFVILFLLGFYDSQ